MDLTRGKAGEGKEGEWTDAREGDIYLSAKRRGGSEGRSRLFSLETTVSFEGSDRELECRGSSAAAQRERERNQRVFSSLISSSCLVYSRHISKPLPLLVHEPDSRASLPLSLFLSDPSLMESVGESCFHLTDRPD